MPHVLDDLFLLDTGGCNVRLARFWADRTVVLLFVRHFGCLFCRQQIADIGPYVDRIRALGAELVVIGHGSVEEARAFQEEQAVDFAILTDPSREAYRALGMRRSAWSALNLVVLVRALAAWRRGFRQSRVAGDPFQQGGLVIIAPGGVERFRFLSHAAGDHPSPERVLEILASPARQ